MGPRLSIIIPFYDDGPWIDDALASTEGEADAEVIVVNDNPGPESDALLSALSDHRDFTIVRHDRNRGLAAARNSGMAVASGDYIAFLDADDVLLSGALTAALEYDGSDAIHTQTLMLGISAKKPQLLPRDAELFADARFGDTLATAPEAQHIASSWCCLYRREFLREFEILFDEAQRRYEDRLFVLSAMLRARSIAFTGAPARVWRRRLGSITTSSGVIDDAEARIALIEKCLRLIRASGTHEQIQRERMVSLQRLIFDIGILDHDPDATPAMDPLRQRFTDVFGPDPLPEDAVDNPVDELVARIGRKTARMQSMDASDYAGVAALASGGDWRRLHQWKLAQIAPPPAPLDVRIDKTLVIHIDMAQDGARADAGALALQRAYSPIFGLSREGDHDAVAEALRRVDTGKADAFLKEAMYAEGDLIFISGSGFLLPLMEPGGREVAFRRIASALEPFAKREVVVSIGPPDKFAESLYGQTSEDKSGWARRTPAQFARETVRTLTDLNWLLSPWESVVAARLTIVPHFEGDSGLAAALHQVGLDPAAAIADPFRDAVEPVFSEAERHLYRNSLIAHSGEFLAARGLPDLAAQLADPSLIPANAAPPPARPRRRRGGLLRTLGFRR